MLHALKKTHQKWLDVQTNLYLCNRLALNEMKRELRKIIFEFGSKHAKTANGKPDLEKLSAHLATKHINLKPYSLKKLRGYLFKEQLSEHTLNRLALFAGFQSWHDLKDAIHGINDPKRNYEV